MTDGNLTNFLRDNDYEQHRKSYHHELSVDSICNRPICDCVRVDIVPARQPEYFDSSDHRGV